VLDLGLKLSPVLLGSPHVGDVVENEDARSDGAVGVTDRRRVGGDPSVVPRPVTGDNELVADDLTAGDGAGQGHVVERHRPAIGVQHPPAGRHLLLKGLHARPGGLTVDAEGGGVHHAYAHIRGIRDDDPRRGLIDGGLEQLPSAPELALGSLAGRYVECSECAPPGPVTAVERRGAEEDIDERAVLAFPVRLYGARAAVADLGVLLAADGFIVLIREVEHPGALAEELLSGVAGHLAQPVIGLEQHAVDREADADGGRAEDALQAGLALDEGFLGLPSAEQGEEGIGHDGNEGDEVVGPLEYLPRRSVEAQCAVETLARSQGEEQAGPELVRFPHGSLGNRCSRKVSGAGDAEDVAPLHQAH